MAIQSVVADALTQATVVDVFVTALKDHEGYKQHLVACVAPVAERIADEYSANVQSATISALRNESVVGEPATGNARAVPDKLTSVEHEDTRATRSTKARKKGPRSSISSDSNTSRSASTHGGPTGERTTSTTDLTSACSSTTTSRRTRRRRRLTKDYGSPRRRRASKKSLRKSDKARRLDA